MSRVVVVGLGPAGADMLLPLARTALEQIAVRFVRTARHAAVADLAADGLAFVALDDHYDRATSLDDAYDAIVATLAAAAAEHGEIAYAVPGNPVTAERTVSALRDAGLDVTVVPGLSFADLAWTRVAVDPMAVCGRVVDGRAFRFEPGALLIAQCDSPLVLSDVKLALLDALTPEHPVTVLQRLGLADERIAVIGVGDLDRDIDPDHLTTLYVDARGARGGVGPSLVRFVELVEQLRGPGGCPWDAEQTHHSLTRHLLEEAYEVVEAIEALPATAPVSADGEPLPAGVYDHLEEELGDLLFQVVIHATLAREAGAFTMAEVATGIHDKLVRRHPHVFGSTTVERGAAGAEQVVRNWEQIKRDEKGRESLMDGIPGSLPSLLYVHELYRKAVAGGLAEPGIGAAVSRVQDVLERATFAQDDIGELLAAAVVLARASGVDAEAALRGWASEFRRWFMEAERTGALGANPPAPSTEGAPIRAR